MYLPLLLVAAFAIEPEALSAGSMIQRLPEDGTWAAFHFTENWTDGTRRTMKVILKSVGKTRVEDEDCRWIELEFQPEAAEDKKNHAWKFLIPEKQFAPEGDPLSHVKEAWMQSDGGTVERMTIERVQEARPRFDHWLPPQVAKLQRTKERQKVEWQGGVMDCEIFAGDQQRTYSKERIDVNYRVLIHEDAPFGVAASELKLQSHWLGAGEVDDYQGTIKFSMIDTGRNAESKVKQTP